MNDRGHRESSGLEQAIGHSFADPGLLDRALSHRSWVAETGQEPSNERLEFLGDTVLQMVVTDFIFDHYPGYHEGKLVPLRASVVDKGTLFDVATEVGLGPYLKLGTGEESMGGRNRPSILADAMEAVLGAIYLDGGLEPARGVILRLWEDRITRAAVQPGSGDYKSRLQESLQSRGARPEYSTSSEGPAHEQRFTAVVTVYGTEYGPGRGSSKKEAQQGAARAALDALADDLENGG